jgi:hypothetical protein
MEAIFALRQTENRSAVAPVRTKYHDGAVFVLDHTRVVNCFHWIGHILFSQDGIAGIAFYDAHYLSTLHYELEQVI